MRKKGICEVVGFKWREKKGLQRLLSDIVTIGISQQWQEQVIYLCIYGKQQAEISLNQNSSLHL